MRGFLTRRPGLVLWLCSASLISACGLTDQELAGIAQTSISAGLTTLLGQVAQVVVPA